MKSGYIIFLSYNIPYYWNKKNSGTWEYNYFMSYQLYWNLLRHPCIQRPLLSLTYSNAHITKIAVMHFRATFRNCVRQRRQRNTNCYNIIYSSERRLKTLQIFTNGNLVIKKKTLVSTCPMLHLEEMPSPNRQKIGQRGLMLLFCSRKTHSSTLETFW